MHIAKPLAIVGGAWITAFYFTTKPKNIPVTDIQLNQNSELLQLADLQEKLNYVLEVNKNAELFLAQQKAIDAKAAAELKAKQKETEEIREFAEENAAYMLSLAEKEIEAQTEIPRFYTLLGIEYNPDEPAVVKTIGGGTFGKITQAGKMAYDAGKKAYRFVNEHEEEIALVMLLV